MSSFDIFDTVLTRRVGDPRSLFLLLGRRLRNKGLVECSSSAFAAARRDAEVRSFRNAGGLDSHVSLESIYRELSASIWVSPSALDKLVEEELALERETLVPLADGVRRIAAARNRGDRIIFVSDMYLDTDFLIDVLRSHALFRDGDRLYVSAAHGQAKASGRLWDVVKDDLDVDASAIHHTGNDHHSDVRTARRAGLRATHVDENNLNRYERALERHAAETDGLASALAGASRLARRHSVSECPDDQVLRDVAAGAIAPFVIGKVLWLLEQSRHAGLEALYFIARDGKILRDVAAELAPKVGFNGELHYLYGSRQAWTLPSLDVGDPAILRSICPDGGEDVASTVRRVLARAEIDVAEIESELIDAGFTSQTWDRVLDADGSARLRALLADDGSLSLRVEQSARSTRELTLRYLEQEGLLSDRQIGIVDLGTGATLFNSLASMLAASGRPAPVAFYLGLRPGVADRGHGLPHAYLRNALAPVGFARTPGLLTLLEMVCTDDHGSVTGYRDAGTVVEPLFGTGGGDVATWGLATVHDTIRRVAAELVLDHDLVSHRNIDLRGAALEAFTLFWDSPTKAEARVWGAYPFEDGWSSDSVSHPIAMKQWPTAAFRRQPHRHWWHGGTERLSGPSTRLLLRGRRSSLELASKVRERFG